MATRYSSCRSVGVWTMQTNSYQIPNNDSLEVIRGRADPLLSTALASPHQGGTHVEHASHRIGRTGRRQPELADRGPGRTRAAPGPAPDREARALQSRADPRTRRARGGVGR